MIDLNDASAPPPRFDLDTIASHLQDFYDAIKKLSAVKQKQ